MGDPRALFESLTVIREKVSREFAFLVEGLVHSKATLIIGEPMAGKSFLATSLALALVRGESEWLGYPINGGPRTVAFGWTDPGAEAELVARMASVGAEGERILGGRIADDGSVTYWDDIADLLCAQGVEAFIVDNLIGSIYGDINSQKDARRYTDGLNKIIDRGISVIVVHHVAKGGEHGPGKSAMGSQHFTGWARSILRLDKRSGDRKHLEVRGNNAAGLGLGLLLEVEDGAGTFTVEKVTTEADREAGRRTRDKETLNRNAEIAGWIVAECQGQSQNRVAESVATKFGLAASTVKTHLSKGHAFGALVERDGTQWRLRAGGEG